MLNDKLENEGKGIDLPSEWSQEDLKNLHDMVRDYGRAKWLRGQLKWWAIWILGVPSAVVAQELRRKCLS